MGKFPNSLYALTDLSIATGRSFCYFGLILEGVHVSKVIDYKSAGVDIEAGDQLVSWLKSQQPENPPHKERIVSSIGGFSALFRADFAEMKKPCLVSATDGVGTKLKLAIEFNSYKEVAQDLVAMCVNDLVCCGASPLFFLDYYATGKLELDKAKEFLGGVQSACTESNCALIGGETAEMPGMYQKNDFDCAGFAVGVVDEERVLGRHLVKPGDVIIGIESSGFHSNGFSLIRKLFHDDLLEYYKELLTPTQLYVKVCQSINQKFPDQIHAMAHITGGGLDNILRIMPESTQCTIEMWELPKMYQEVLKRSGLSLTEMLKTLNCGIGLVIIAEEGMGPSLMETIKRHDLAAFKLGHVEPSSVLSPTWSIKGEP